MVPPPPSVGDPTFISFRAREKRTCPMICQGLLPLACLGSWVPASFTHTPASYPLPLLLLRMNEAEMVSASSIMPLRFVQCFGDMTPFQSMVEMPAERFVGRRSSWHSLDSVLPTPPAWYCALEAIPDVFPDRFTGATLLSCILTAVGIVFIEA